VHVVLDEGTPKATDVVDVYDVASGKLLRTLEGIAPKAMAICR
jgi:hypothetical protein